MTDDGAGRMNGQLSDVQRLITAMRDQQESIDRLVKVLEQRQPDATTEPAAAPDGPAGAGSDRPKRQRPIDWTTLAGEERRIEWLELAGWVEALVHRYNLHRLIRPCWWQHADAVEEFSALKDSREQIYRERDDLNGAMNWRDTFSKCCNRIGGTFASCRDGHVDVSKKDWMPADVRAAFQRHVSKEARLT